jgi:hypothetical protein
VRRWLVLGLIAAATWMALEYASDPFESTGHYVTRAEAEAAGLFSRGWFPEFLPETMRDVCETHQIDSNVVCATFLIDTSGAAGFATELHRRGFEKIAAAGSALGRCIHRDRCGFRRHRCDAFPVIFGAESPVTGRWDYVAIDPAGSRVCYWTGESPATK